MAEHKNIYLNKTEQYHALVSFEDSRHNLPKTIKLIIGEGFPDIIETGVGTSRLTEILMPLAGKLVGFDISPAMPATANLKKNNS
jgi:predicted TPR repeat methyltransferase